MLLIRFRDLTAWIKTAADFLVINCDCRLEEDEGSEVEQKVIFYCMEFSKTNI